MLVDGWNNSEGEFCLEVTNLSPNAVTEISNTGIEIFPNPTTDEIRLTNVQADAVQVYDNTGWLVKTVAQPGNSLDLSSMPAGLYLLKITESGEVYSARVVKE
jgi:hypothetical protein